MSDPNPNPADPTPDPAPDPAPDPTPDPTPDTDAEVKKWKDLARKHEDRAKANATAAKDLEALQAKHMTDQEKAVADAKAEGRSEALSEAGPKIARAEFKAAAKDRLDEAGLEALLASLDLKAFLDDDGDVDATKVQTFVDTIAPPKEEVEETPGDLLAGLDLGQGVRSKVAGLGSSQLERDLRKSLGIS